MTIEERIEVIEKDLVAAKAELESTKLGEFREEAMKYLEKIPEEYSKDLKFVVETSENYILLKSYFQSFKERWVRVEEAQNELEKAKASLDIILKIIKTGENLNDDQTKQKENE